MRVTFSRPFIGFVGAKFLAGLSGHANAASVSLNVPIAGSKNSAKRICAGVLFFCLCSVAHAQVLDETVRAEYAGQFSSLPPQVQGIDAGVIPKGARLDEDDPNLYALVYIISGGTDIFGLMETAVNFDDDPLMNLRFELSNFTDQQQFYSLQIKFPTDVTAGATFNDSWANIELFDDSGDGNASLFDGSTFFEVIDDPGGDLINGSANLGESFFYSRSEVGKTSLFDNVGAGPNSDDFDGDGFNWMRFVTSGHLSAGDRLAITGMGCYATTADYCPERYEIPAIPSPVPIPAAAWLFGSALGFLGWMKRKAA